MSKCCIYIKHAVGPSSDNIKPPQIQSGRTQRANTSHSRTQTRLKELVFSRLWDVMIFLTGHNFLALFVATWSSHKATTWLCCCSSTQPEQGCKLWFTFPALQRFVSPWQRSTLEGASFSDNAFVLCQSRLKAAAAGPTYIHDTVLFSLTL